MKSFFVNRSPFHNEDLKCPALIANQEPPSTASPIIKLSLDQSYKGFGSSLTVEQNTQGLVPGIPCQPCLMFVGKAVALAFLALPFRVYSRPYYPWL